VPAGDDLLGTVISFPLSAIGLILGVIGLILAMTQKNKNIGLPIAGAVTNVVALLIGVAMWIFVINTPPTSATSS